jgi:hypothetical protein
MGLEAGEGGRRMLSDLGVRGGQSLSLKQSILGVTYGWESAFDYSFDMKTRRTVVKNYLAVLELQSSKVFA